MLRIPWRHYPRIVSGSLIVRKDGAVCVGRNGVSSAWPRWSSVGRTPPADVFGPCADRSTLLRIPLSNVCLRSHPLTEIPGIHRFRVGSFACTVICDSEVPPDDEASIGFVNATPDEVAAAMQRLREHGTPRG